MSCLSLRLTSKALEGKKLSSEKKKSCKKIKKHEVAAKGNKIHNKNLESVDFHVSFL